MGKTVMVVSENIRDVNDFEIGCCWLGKLLDQGSHIKCNFQRMAGFRTKLSSHGVSYGRRSTSIFPACMVYSLTETMFLYLLLFIQLLTTYPSSHQFFGRQQWNNLQECMYNYIFLCMYTVTIFRRMYFCEFIMFHWQSTWKRLIGVPLQPRVATSMFS